MTKDGREQDWGNADVMMARPALSTATTALELPRFELELSDADLTLENLPLTYITDVLFDEQGAFVSKAEGARAPR
jgi:hypothetical protein